MDLEHGYFHTANSPLSFFADDANWAIVFEKSGYANRAGMIELELNYFDKRLRNLKPGGLYHHFTYNSKYLPLVDCDELEEIAVDFEIVSPSATHVKVRDQYVRMPSRKEEYQKWVPDILTREYPEAVTFEGLVRYLTFEYEQLCRATLGELNSRRTENLSAGRLAASDAD